MRDKNHDLIAAIAQNQAQKAVFEPLKPDFRNTPESEMCACEPQNPDHVEFFKGGDIAPCLFARYHGFQP